MKEILGGLCCGAMAALLSDVQGHYGPEAFMMIAFTIVGFVLIIFGVVKQLP